MSLPLSLMGYGAIMEIGSPPSVRSVHPNAYNWPYRWDGRGDDCHPSHHRRPGGDRHLASSGAMVAPRLTEWPAWWPLSSKTYPSPLFASQEKPV